MYSSRGGYNNTLVGKFTGRDMTHAYANAFFGHVAGEHVTTGYSNTLIGTGAGEEGSGSAFFENVYLGSAAGGYQRGGKEMSLLVEQLVWELQMVITKVTSM